MKHKVCLKSEALHEVVYWTFFFFFNFEKALRFLFAFIAVLSLACQKNFLVTYHSQKSISAVKSLTKADLNRKRGKYFPTVRTAPDCDTFIVLANTF